MNRTSARELRPNGNSTPNGVVVCNVVEDDADAAAGAGRKEVGSNVNVNTSWRRSPLISRRAQLRGMERGGREGLLEGSQEPARARKRFGEDFWKENWFWVFFALLCLACVLRLVVLYFNSPWSQFTEEAELLSLPIVSVLFTWGHIWLAIQMMFYPLSFWGCCNIRNSGYGLGWQGIVPRKAGIMAEKSCELMVGRLITMEEIVDRINMDEFFETLGTVLQQCQRNVNERLGREFWASLWTRLPEGIKDEILNKVMEASRETFEPMMKDIRQEIKYILNVKEMCVQRYTEEPILLVNLFQQVGRKEFQFIQRCGAQMGLILGLAQMGLYFATKSIPWMPWVLLPLSGLIIGNFTNWIAIKMIFYPTHPHLYCGGRLNWQGLFLKRQKEVAKELSSMLADTTVNSEAMIRYLVSSPGYTRALEIFYRHTANATDEALGVAKSVVPMAFGAEFHNGLRKAAVEALLDELPKHSSHFIKYMDHAMVIEETMAVRLAELPPDQFEGMLHPAFQEDEWMLILLGGVLGVIVGFFQAAVLGQ
eukprot:TRINITY_DN122886_c0_g1_i1.p1 TRINITY_DN122886_c0_g1~~TRINITY_DN122886_c0_g1_i1.p1  ORF type:complete len:537 (+),score=134.58 TRINITY_DN122886_c0_g1_i1:240-1850(+)